MWFIFWVGVFDYSYLVKSFLVNLNLILLIFYEGRNLGLVLFLYYNI